ncbi:MAG: hypothetical protein KME15_13090 [Drouetiella hepatica Uher 2000/2452]|jgi:hypothetical protein|uniref:Uncharacterized protein n=1 Tax=Drouetiella hepatica Uher 2000/2452 TaxID=904376 RepID=A0A951QCY2_9CYAN|nr:hypothetical protein [Drouetiella hepatica Uher 2000/2452]
MIKAIDGLVCQAALTMLLMFRDRFLWDSPTKIYPRLSNAAPTMIVWGVAIGRGCEDTDFLRALRQILPDDLRLQ